MNFNFLFFILLLSSIQIVYSHLIISIDNDNNNNGFIKYSIFNDGDYDDYFLSYDTPFHGIFYSLFDIKSSSNFVEYIGPIGRFIIPPPQESIISIPSKSTLSILINIHEYYNIPSNDNYEISLNTFKFNSNFILSQSSFSTNLLKSFSTNKHHSQKERDNQYENCSVLEKNQVASAEHIAEEQSKNAEKCMANNSCDSLTTKWFGTSSNNLITYYNYDLNVFSDVYNELNSTGIHAYCNPQGCGPSVYAYVYPNDPSMTVNLCGAFWSQADERANTIVHEMSHFTVLGGTNDYTYGKVSCLALAEENQFEASHNADNVCYFSAEA